MATFVPGFVFGIWVVSRLPALHESLSLLVWALPLTTVVWRYRWLALPVGMLLGAWWAVETSTARLATQVPAAMKGIDLLLVGHVSSLPRVVDGEQRFSFTVEQGPLTGTLLLGYQGTQELVPGDRLKIITRLSRGHGTLNSHLFDYSGWLLMRGYAGRGYVKDLRARTPGWRALHHQIRFSIRRHLQHTLADSPSSRLLIALAIGDHHQISTTDWQKLSATGTNHLLIVSGLHVGLVMAGTFALARFGRVRLRSATALSILAGLLFGAVAGLGLPVQRSLIMATVLAVAMSSRRTVSLFTGYFWALLVVLVLEPLSVLSPGFYLSFSAVGALLLGLNGYVVSRGWSGSLLQAQWVVTVALLPVLLMLFHEASLVSFFVNLFAIPWISLLVIPPLLLYLLLFSWLPAVAVPLLEFAHLSLEFAWRSISWAADANLILPMAAVDSWTAVIASLGAVLWLLPKGVVPRPLIALFWLPLLLAAPRAELTQVADQWRVTFIDVGQGMSVLVQTPGHNLLYDAGPRFGNRFDAGDQVVVPYLKSLGVRRLDYLVVSHTDVDHAGGADAVMRRLEVLQRYDMADCQVPRQWHRAGFYFRLFSLGEPSRHSTNNLSCLLLVSTGDDGILLTGDIEQAVEANLASVALPDILLLSVPHHGSRSSSSGGFINRLMPEIAVVSSGSGNRFGHPHEEVSRRYTNRHVRLLRADRSGGISILLQGDRVIRLDEARRVSRRFWHPSN